MLLLFLYLLYFLFAVFVAKFVVESCWLCLLPCLSMFYLLYLLLLLLLLLQLPCMWAACAAGHFGLVFGWQTKEAAWQRGGRVSKREGNGRATTITTSGQSPRLPRGLLANVFYSL